MKKPLAVGDRVRLRGYSAKGYSVEGDTGRVQELLTSDRGPLLKIKLDDGSYPIVYPSQVKSRLVKKERREWEIMGVHHKHAIISSQREREIVWHGPELADGERVVVREVRPRKENAK